MLNVVRMMIIMVTSIVVILVVILVVVWRINCTGGISIVMNPNNDCESASGFISIHIRRRIKNMMTSGGESVTGQIRGHDMLNADIVLENGFTP